jgi:hypothetical protein
LSWGPGIREYITRTALGVWTRVDGFWCKLLVGKGWRAFVAGLLLHEEASLLAADVNGLVRQQPPVAANDLYAIQTGATLTVSAAEGVSANDFDMGGDPMAVTLGATMPAVMVLNNPTGELI